MSENEDKKSLVVFQDKTIRRTWHNNEWYFSVVDVVAVLTDSVNPGSYWRKLKQRLTEEGSQVVTNCHGLKLPAPDGKMRTTDCANIKGMFRIIQSIPSPKAEPEKLPAERRHARPALGRRDKKRYEKERLIFRISIHETTNTNRGLKNA
jgi:hypothetical protein